MASVESTRSMARKRTIAYAVGAAALLLVLVAGHAFANSVSVMRVTNNARALHWVNATMGTSALTRVGLAQAVTFAELEQGGIAAHEELEFALDELGMSAAELQHLLRIGSAHEAHPSLDRFLTAVGLAVRDLEEGDLVAARERFRDRVEVAYSELVDTLGAEQQSIQAAVEDNTAAGRAINAWVVFVVTLGVPGSAVAAYWMITRRQTRALKERNQIELEAERSISKAKDAFIAGLSHELRTPLTAINGFAEVLAEGEVTGVEGTREMAQIIANEGAEMARMVDDLLAASRLESTGVEFEIEPTRVQELVSAVVAPFQRAGAGIDLTPTTAVAAADPGRLRQVLVNLVSNAVRHGGPDIGVEVTTNDRNVEIEVWDSGAGIPDDRVDDLDKRFVHSGATPLLTGSVGLGLAVAYRLTALMDGSLEYRRSSTRTRFTVTLPVAATADEEGAADQASVVADMITAPST
jgi:signal transduction histidine kinase